MIKINTKHKCQQRTLVILVAVFLILMFIGIFGLIKKASASSMTVNHTYSSAVAGAGSNHTFSFTTLHSVPISGALQVNFPSGLGTTGMDFNDVDLLVNGEQRTLAANRSPSEDGVAFYSSNVYIEMGIMIPLGASVEIRMGTNATHQVAGDSQFTNPQTNGVKNFPVIVYPNLPGISDTGIVSMTVTGGINTGGALTVTHSPAKSIYEEAVNRTLTLTSTNGIPVNGVLKIYFWDTTDVEAGLSYADMDLIVNGTQRTLAAVASATEDGVNIAANILTFTVSSSNAIPAGATIEVRVGTNATHQTTGVKRFRNPMSSPYFSDGTVLTETNGEESIDSGTLSSQFVASNTIQFAATSSQGPESTTSVNITVSTDAVSSLAASATYTVSGTASGAGTDYTLANGTITVPAGTTTAAITLIVVDDLAQESDETVIVTLSSPTNAILGANAVHTYTIQNDDTDVSVLVSQTESATNVAEGGATDTYYMNLTAAPTANVVVTVTPNAQVSVSPTSITFTPSMWSSPMSVTVTAVDDAVVEGGHTGTITHSATSTDARYNGISIQSITVSVADNDVGSTPETPSTPYSPTPEEESAVDVGTTTDAGTTTTVAKELKFSDVDGKIKSKTQLGRIKQVAELLQAHNTYKFKKKFYVNNKVTYDFALRAALAIAGKDCGVENPTAKTCKAAAVEAGLIGEKDKLTKYIKRGALYELFMKAAGLEVDPKAKPRKTLCKDLGLKDEKTGAILASAWSNKVLVRFKGYKCYADKYLSRKDLTGIAAKVLRAKELKEKKNLNGPNLVLAKSDPLCTAGPDSHGDIGGSFWPVHKLYYRQGVLGALFTAMACGDARVREVNSGKVNTDVGYYSEIYPGPSKSFKQTLLNIGFEFVEKTTRQECTFPNGKNNPCVLVDIQGTLHEKWNLTKSVPISSLYSLRAYTNENWDADWGGLKE